MKMMESTGRSRRPAHAALSTAVVCVGALSIIDCGGVGGEEAASATSAAGDGATSSAATMNAAGAGGAPGQTATTGFGSGASSPSGSGGACAEEDPAMAAVRARVERGRATFRHETFGDEAFWGGKLRLHEAIAGEANGGVGPGISPVTALALGLKVDQEAIPPAVAEQIAAGQVDLEDPATTVALLGWDAVIGVKGFFDEDTRLTSVGIQCALCHTAVDDAFAPGIGRRRDGWPNRDLNVGAIIAAAPDLTPVTTLLGVDREAVVAVLEAWGPGRFDAALLLDGKGFRPDGGSAATLIPAAFGQSGNNLHTYTGWGSTTHWNAFVAVIEMHGQGNFTDERLDDAARFPIAAKNGFSKIRVEEDLVTDKLADLHFYQLTLEPPEAPAGSFDFEAAQRGEALFEGEARCSSCHVPPLYTEPGWNMHTPEEIGIDSFQADRSPEGRYRTTPLRGMSARTKGGYYHDGRFATLDDVVAHYDDVLDLGLDDDEAADLVAFLQSL